MTREQAKSLGIPRYFTGKPCPRGHLSTRLVSCRACEECSRVGRRIIRGQNENPPRPKPDRCEARGCLPGWRGLHEDHDKVNGRFRGWICASCNTAIGLLGDSIEGLENTLEYLERAKQLHDIQSPPFWLGVALGISDVYGNVLLPRAA